AGPANFSLEGPKGKRGGGNGGLLFCVRDQGNKLEGASCPPRSAARGFRATAVRPRRLGSSLPRWIHLLRTVSYVVRVCLVGSIGCDGSWLRKARIAASISPAGAPARG
ncbi:unnamed protein product, partial [Ectocarpus sp. 12 AP-2014]